MAEKWQVLTEEQERARIADRADAREAAASMVFHGAEKQSAGQGQGAGQGQTI